MFACLYVSQFAKMFLDVLNKIIMCIYNILITIIYHNKNVYYMLADVQAYNWSNLHHRKYKFNIELGIVLQMVKVNYADKCGRVCVRACVQLCRVLAHVYVCPQLMTRHVLSAVKQLCNNGGKSLAHVYMMGGGGKGAFW